jgi:hypothetical protein
LVILEKHRFVGLKKKKRKALERPYKTGSVTRWNNDWDSVDTITKKPGGRGEGLEIKSAGKNHVKDARGEDLEKVRRYGIRPRNAINRTPRKRTKLDPPFARGPTLP